VPGAKSNLEGGFPLCDGQFPQSSVDKLALARAGEDIVPLAHPVVGRSGLVLCPIYPADLRCFRHAYLLLMWISHETQAIPKAKSRRLMTPLVVFLIFQPPRFSVSWNMPPDQIMRD
jgi:hypothetical protein